ncbi:ATP-binding protein [Arcicella sp. DC2W]|uniref:ATP-binding protein n=1 Tax=Arcicella gelida TaxID=2984195 RepID=A0ABU5S1S2_9BACT|nr:ATP-binding protein [Arcicella sp. DC2W]MEA5402421.1 ATP-binding protein [Arcicella sp. DC2W]
MNFNIDLKELSTRESERVEWKENGDNVNIVNSIVKTISAFANDISNFGGGYVVCGAKETKDEYGFPKVQYTGLSANKLKEIEGKVTQHCRDYVSPTIAPIVHEINNPFDASTKVLVFVILATSEAHSYRDGTTSNYYVRISRETKEARNGVLAQLLIKKQKLEYFDKRVNPIATQADIDILFFRDILQEMSLLSPEKSLEDYFSDREQIAELVVPLFAKINLDNILRPRNFTVLIFGKKHSITVFYPEAYTIFSIYKGVDRSEPTAERYTLTGNIIEQAKKTIELLNTQSYTAFDKTSHKPNQVKYPMRALQEAVVNAIVHRDYEIPEPIRITVFTDRIEIKSAGSLHWGVDKEKFLKGKASPKWRNQSFAYLFNKLQLAQSEGQGIPTIFRTMKEEGCPEPIFEIEPENVTCILPAHPRHQIIREQQEIQDKIILEKYQEAKEQVLTLLDKDLYNFRTIDLYCEIITKLRQPQDLFNLLETKKVDFYSVNPNTLINIAEILSYDRDNIQYQAVANRALSVALSGKIEESQIIKAVVSLKKIGEPEDVVKFVSDAINKYPNLTNNTTLLEKRATSKMDLAKKCINTAKDHQSNPKTKARAWEMCRQLLDEAERDLLFAMNNAESLTEKSFIDKDIKFLESMKKVSKKPNKKSF